MIVHKNTWVSAELGEFMALCAEAMGGGEEDGGQPE